MSDLLELSLKHLQALVAFDTRNPPRNMNTGGIFAYLREHLPGFSIEITDHGQGAVSLYAVRGKPDYLFNVHLDTVPDSPHWHSNPHSMQRCDDRVIGLGVCDIKGAAAAMLAAANSSHGDVAFLFSNDEEANDPRGVSAFIARKLDYKSVIVAEPTMSKAVVAHRGIASALIKFKGQAGHASGKQDYTSSALHQAVRWGSLALAYVESLENESFGELQGLRFNIGQLIGGIKANMIAPQAELRFGFRPLPSMDTDQLLDVFSSLAQPQAEYFAQTFRGPSLPAGNIHQAKQRHQAAVNVANQLGLALGEAVDFWTEASLFSAAGYTALVYGPGNIAQAHTANEWLSLGQLQSYAQSLYNILQRKSR